MSRFVIKHKHKGYFMQGSTHLLIWDRFSQNLQDAKVFANHAAAVGSITVNFGIANREAVNNFIANLQILPVYLCEKP